MEVCSHNGFDPNTILLKINGTKCNLNCMYCSETKKSYKSSMCSEECRDVIAALPISCDIILHGGEPLLDREAVNMAISAFRKKKTGRRLSIQTNGCIDSDMKQLLLENSDILKIGISIDGPNEQNRLRVDNYNNPVFQQIDETISFFEKHNIDIKCIATVNTANVADPIVTLEYFLSHRNIKQVRFNPCFDMNGESLADYAIKPLQFLDYILKITEYWIKHKIYKIIRIDPIQAEFEAALRPLTKPKINCHKFISIYPNGQSTICDALGTEVFEYGEVSKIFLDAEQRFNNTLVPPCQTCKDYLECGGGCVAMFRRFNGIEVLTEDYCQYRKRLKQYVRGVMSELA